MMEEKSTSIDETPAPASVTEQEQVQAEEKPRQWLYDRCNGEERVMDPDTKPCCCLLYPNALLKLWPGLLESNRFMESIGRIGIFSYDNKRARKIIFGIVMVTSTCGWICIVLSCLALSKDFSIIKAFEYNYGEADYYLGPDQQVPTDVRFTNIHVGLSAVAWNRLESYTVEDGRPEEAQGLQDVVTGFDEFCDGDQGVFFVDPAQCDACEQASTQMITTLLMSTVFFFFTFKNDVLRFFLNYDVNCQKFMSVFVAVVTIGLALSTFFVYRRQCFSSFLEGTYCFLADGTYIDCEDWLINKNSDAAPADDILAQITVNADLVWWPGVGFILLGVGIFARVFSVICNLLIPTPPITRDADLQWEYERIVNDDDYVKKNTE
jgi:hypothetical protein